MPKQTSGRVTHYRQCRQCTIHRTVAGLVLAMLAGTAQGQEAEEQPDDSPSGAEGIMADWLPRSALSPEQQASLHNTCCGLFVEPPRDGEYADVDPDSAPTEIDTPTRVRQPEPGQLYVDGEVTVRQGYRNLRSTNGLHLDESTNILTLQGDVIFREPGFLVTGQGAQLDQNNNDNELYQAAYVVHETQVHGTAGMLSYNSDSGMMTLENGEFSRCEPMDPFWKVQAHRLRLDNARGVGYATELTLRLRDVPVFYYPYTLQFPIGDQRVSGLLPPSVSNSRDGGLDLAVPYYFNLAPHYDATLTPRIVTKRGPMMSGEFRYLSSWSMNTVNASLMPRDNTYDPDSSSGRKPSREKRWFAGFEHEGRLGEHWRTYVDYAAISDADYFRDLGVRDLNVESRSNLNREGRLTWQNNGTRADVRVQRTEIIDPYLASIDIHKPFDRLPELRLSTQQEAGFGLRYGLDSSHVTFDRSLNPEALTAEQVENGALVTGQRMSADPWVSLPLRRPGYFLVPTLRYRYTQWDLEDQALGTDSDPQRGIGVFSLDSGLVFERPVSFAGSAAVQTLEPRLYYLYSEREEQQLLPTFDTAQLNFSFNQLFREDRFSGQDRIGDANQLSAAITTRFITQDGRERAHFSLGQIFHFKDRTVSLDSPLRRWQLLQPLDTDRSALVMEGSYAPGNAWRITSNVQWDQENNNFDEGSLSIQYHADSNHLINLAYRYREKTDIFLDAPPQLRSNIRQTDLSAIWPINNNWRLLGRWNYDHSNSRNLETFAGVEYSNCCATMRLIARDWVNDYEFIEQDTKQNRGLFFQFTLHGLGNLTGGGLSSLLTNSIPGFEEREF